MFLTMITKENNYRVVSEPIFFQGRQNTTNLGIHVADSSRVSSAEIVLNRARQSLMQSNII